MPMKLILSFSFQSQKVFDPKNLGRGTLRNLKENNFEFGGWNPQSSSGGDSGVSEGARVVETVIEKMDYFPMDDKVKLSRSGELLLENSREERDSRFSIITTIHLSLLVYLTTLSF
jgi:hypothetical protein